MRITTLGAIAMIALALAACGQSESKTPPVAPPAPQVTVAKPVTRQIADHDEYVGRFVAVDSIEVRARVSGYLEAIHF
jgi:multidrug efflux pump subunit AcrA (membrane-fusion protein)